MTAPLDLPAARARLLELIKELAVVRGKVILSSGAEADYYIDLRRITLHHEASKLVGQVILALLDEAGITDIGSVGGLTMGADPVATAVMHAAADAGRAVDAFVVRKAQKSYGMGRQVEGPEVAGRKVVALEDTSTTGGSALTAVQALRQGGRPGGCCRRDCGPGYRRQGAHRGRGRGPLPLRLQQERPWAGLAPQNCRTSGPVLPVRTDAPDSSGATVRSCGNFRSDRTKGAGSGPPPSPAPGPGGRDRR